MTPIIGAPLRRTRLVVDALRRCEDNQNHNELCCRCALLIELFPVPIFNFFGVNDAEIIAFGIPGLRIYSVSIVLGILVYILMSYMQITSQKLFAVSISALTELVSTASIFAAAHLLGVTGLWSAGIICNAIMLIYIWSGTRYIAAKSNGNLHGIFLHERAAQFCHRQHHTCHRRGCKTIYGLCA